MKKQITTIVATVSLIVTLTAIGIAGLVSNVTANIPFDFAIGGKTLPAGKYTVMKGTAQDMLIIQSADKKASAGVITQSGDAKTKGKASLEFHRYGNQYFLAAVSDGIKVGELPMTNAERKAARGKDNLAVNETKPETVIVNAAVGQ